MRYTCGECGKWVKDKFIFGTLHVCLSDEEIAAKRYRQIFGVQQGPPQPSGLYGYGSQYLRDHEPRDEADKDIPDRAVGS